MKINKTVNSLSLASIHYLKNKTNKNFKKLLKDRSLKQTLLESPRNQIEKEGKKHTQTQRGKNQRAEMAVQLLQLIGSALSLEEAFRSP